MGFGESSIVKKPMESEQEVYNEMLTHPDVLLYRGKMYKWIKTGHAGNSFVYDMKIGSYKFLSVFDTKTAFPELKSGGKRNSSSKLEKLTRKQLLERCKERGFRGVSKKTKVELIQTLRTKKRRPPSNSKRLDDL